MIFALALVTAAVAVEPFDVLPWTGPGLQPTDNDDSTDHSGDDDTWNTRIHKYMTVPFVENFEEPLPVNNNSLNAVHYEVPNVNITIPPCQIGKKDFNTIFIFIIVILALLFLIIGVFLSFIRIQRTWHYEMIRAIELDQVDATQHVL